MALDVPAHLFTAHRPRRHRRARPRRRRSRSTATPSAWRPCTRRPTRSRASREAMVAVGDSGSCIQLLAPLDRESTIAKFLDRKRPGPPAAGLPGHRRRGRVRGPARARRPPAVRRAAARHGRLAGSTSSTPRTPAACWSSSWSRPTRSDTGRRETRLTRAPLRVTDRYLCQRRRPPAIDPQETTCSRSSTPSVRHRDRRRLRRPRDARDATAPPPSTRTRSTCSRAWRAATRTRASRCTSRTCRCPSSAPARRWSR